MCVCACVIKALIIWLKCVLEYGATRFEFSAFRFALPLLSVYNHSLEKSSTKLIYKDLKFLFMIPPPKKEPKVLIALISLQQRQQRVSSANNNNTSVSSEPRSHSTNPHYKPPLAVHRIIIVPPIMYSSRGFSLYLNRWCTCSAAPREISIDRLISAPTRAQCSPD